MDSYQFYKSLYDRELNRRTVLDSAINLPMTILSIIVAGNSYLVNESDWTYCLNQVLIQKVLISLTIIGLGVSIFYLTRSYNNFFKGFAYRNFGLATAIRKFENDLDFYNRKVDREKYIHFENIILEKLTSIIDDHIIFNDKRSHDLYSAKTALIICLILTIMNFIIFSFKFLKV